MADLIIKNKKILTQFLSKFINYFKKGNKSNKKVAPKNRRNKYGFPRM
jgi:hypothetical protein